MKLRLLSAQVVAGLALIASAGGVCANEINYWPFWVERTEAESGAVFSSGLGPFLFSHPTSAGIEVNGFRPLWEEVRTTEGHVQLSGSLIYPLAHWETDPTTGYRKWTIFNLINFDQLSAEGPSGFDVWPLYFSRDSGDDATSYQALFPIYGDITHRFSQDRLTWALFPLYGRFQKGRAITTTTPWPFIKTVTGEGHRGFEVWPLGGYREETGVSTDAFALWPLIYRQQTHLDSAQSSLKTGVLPFYALDRQPGYQSETYLWPFFGYVDRTAPYRYHARHYLWPLWVQGRGDDRYVNRWAPIYSHSHIKGHDKTWVLWPLWRQATWADAKLQHERRQLLYFLYHETTQRDRTNPDLAPARKTHVWPLFSSWDNGAGQKQFQALSPFEVFLPHQDRTRRLWSPLFALYRSHQTAPGETRRSFLWDAVTYARSEALNTREFHLGPLIDYHSHDEGEHIGFLTGLFGLKRAPDQRAWRPYLGRQQPTPLSLAP